MNTVTFPKHLSLERSESLLPELAARMLKLDLQELRSVERHAGWLISSALLSTRPDRIVLVPPREQPRRILDVTGLSFALAYAPQVSVHDPSFDYEGLVGPWRGVWSYQDQAVLRESQLDLFLDPDDPEPHVLPPQPELFASVTPSFSDPSGALAAFLNPHLAGRPDGAFSAARAVGAWLLTLLPERAKSDVGLTREVHRLVEELLFNVCDHAVAGARSSSLILVNWTRGNNPSRRYRVQLVVMDNGPGIVATATPRKRDPTWTDEQLLGQILVGDAVPRAGRGYGLPWVAARVARLGGQLRIFTHQHAVRSGHGISNPDVTACAFPVGTAVMVSIDVAQRVPDA